MNRNNRNIMRSLTALGAAAATMVLPLAGVEVLASPASAQGAKIVLTEEDYYTGGTAYTFWNSAFAEYHKLHPNVTIERHAVAQTGYIPLLLDQAGAGALPNIVMLDNPYVAEFASSGVLAPLRSIGPINTSGLAPTELYDGIYKGTLYAIPPYTNTNALFYNKTMLAAAHLSPPTTWAQLVADAKALTTPQVSGFVTSIPAENDQAFWEFAAFLWSNAGADATAHISSPQAIAALNVFVQMERDGSMPKAAASWSGGQNTQLFEAGKAAMDEDGSWNIPAFNSTKGLNYGVVELPTAAPGQKLLVPTGGETWAISRTGTAAQQRAALDFLKWIITPKEDATEAVQVGGLIPTVKSAVGLALAQEPPSLRSPLAVFAKELENGGTPRTRFIGNGFSAVTTTVGNAIDAAFLGTQTPAQAFRSIAATVKSELHSAGE